MKTQVNRLPGDTGKGLAGAHIDRGRSISFSLNGRVAHGFIGDTVLTALIASGVDTIGTLDGHPLGLRRGAAPPIAHVGTAHDPQQALPMDRTLAMDGAEYVTVGDRTASGLFARLFQPGRTLGLVVNADGSGLASPWRGVRGSAEEPVDLLVIGAGVAGMSAALAGAIAGLKVTLVEASPRLGGHSGLFGTQDGESSPEENVAHLFDEIAASDAITVNTATEVFAITEDLARAHQVDTSGGTAKGRVVDLPAKHIVIATGSLERLPIFAGNRLPGVVGAMEAFELAQRYGIWTGTSWLLATTSNPSYRLGTLLQDTGLKLDRIVEGRDRANSRYIEFCKAYGIRQFPGTTPSFVSATKSGASLSVHLPHSDPVPVERVVACGGFQPDLTLWHIAGGASHWHREGQRLEPRGTLAGIALAGSAAGYLTRRGCITSGFDAVDRLLGREGRGVDDPVIDAIYETRDGWMIGPEGEDTAPPAYLEGDRTLLVRPVTPQQSWSQRFFDRQPKRSRVLSEAPQSLDIGAICAGVALGLIPAASAGIVAQERVALVPLAQTAPTTIKTTTPVLPTFVPPWLDGRFGRDQRVATLDHDKARLLGPGALIYASGDIRDPQSASGVVLRTTNGQTMALVSATAPKNVIVRDSGQEIAAVIAPLPVQTA